MRVLWLAVLTLGTGLSCATPQPEPISLLPKQELKPQDYEQVLAKWTRDDKVYRKVLDSILFVHATFHSPEFRQAFLLRHPDVYGRGSEEARRLALISEGAEEQLEFFFSAYTSETKWNDFDRHDSIWRVTLQGDDDEVVDGEVVRLKTTANLRVIYPYITDFARTYAVRFPRTTVTGKPVITSRSKMFTLRLSSALGRAELVWKLQPHGALAPLERPPETMDDTGGGLN